MSFLIIIILTLILAIFNGFKILGLVNSLFLSSLFVFCFSLLLFLFSDGAFSIMGHSFRRFHYMTAPKRLKETMEDDELYTNKEIKIRQLKYPITMPLLVTSSVTLVIALLLSFFL
ncbi:DUF3899 domain-containing protein [Macrococcus lamae]|nr:DUF3899 domain-containing protein [Macrococcus lamae]